MHGQIVISVFFIQRNINVNIACNRNYMTLNCCSTCCLCRYDHHSVKRVESLGWQSTGEFVVNEKMQLTPDGEEIPPESYQCAIVGKALPVPVPEVSSLSPGDARPLFTVLKEELPESTFFGAVMLGGGFRIMFTKGKKLNQFIHGEK